MDSRTLSSSSVATALTNRCLAMGNNDCSSSAWLTPKLLYIEGHKENHHHWKTDTILRIAIRRVSIQWNCVRYDEKLNKMEKVASHHPRSKLNYSFCAIRIDTWTPHIQLETCLGNRDIQRTTAIALTLLNFLRRDHTLLLRWCLARIK